MVQRTPTASSPAAAPADVRTPSQHRKTAEIPAKGKSRQELAAAAEEVKSAPRVDAANESSLGDIAERLKSGEQPLLGPMRVRSLMLTLLVLLSVCYTLYFARPILLPIFLAFILNLLFRPPVRWLRKRKIPAALAAILVVAAGVLSVAAIGWMLVEPAAAWLEQVPANLQEIKEKLAPLKEPLDELNKASQQAEEALSGGPDPAAPASYEEPIDAPDPGEQAPALEAEAVAPGVVVVTPPDGEATSAESAAPAVVQRQPWRVRLEGPGLSRVLLSTTWEVAAAIALTLVLLYFLLASGDTYLNKLVEAVPTWRGKRNVVETALQIEQSVSRYLFTITLINVGQGVAVGLAMWMLGMPSPALWGAMACLLTFIPFIGATIGLGVVFLVALMEFETAAQALWAPALYAVIGSIQGQLITPTVLGRRMSLNPVMVLLSLIFWGWMWGIGGAILAVPILAIVTATCCNIERFKGLGEFLSAPPRPT